MRAAGDASRGGAETAALVLALGALAVLPLFLSPFRVELMGKFLVFGILALALDLAWGYTGLLSLGHGVFFGIGGYLVGLSLKLQQGIPEFMVWMGLKEVPAWMAPLSNPYLAFGLALALPAALAAGLGFFLFKSRVTGVYFSIITLALAALFQIFLVDQQGYTGGFNGITEVPRLKLFGYAFRGPVPLYYLVLGWLAVVYAASRALVRSHTGLVLTAIRDNEDRTRFLAYDPAVYKIFVFTISAAIAGLAGALFVPLNLFISPHLTGILFSTAVVIWVAVGGRGTLYGALLGALLVGWAQTYMSESFPVLWQLIVGSLFIAIVLLVPDGIVGSARSWWAARRPAVPASGRVATVHPRPRARGEAS